MKKAVVILHILFVISVLLGCLVYLLKNGFALLILLVPFALVTEAAALVVQIVAYKKAKTKGAVYQMAVTAILVFILCLTLIQFYLFVL